MNFKGFERNQSDLFVIRSFLELNYKHRGNLIIGLGLASVIRSPVVYGFAATPVTDSTILYQENCTKVIRMPFMATAMSFVEFQN